MPLLLESVMSLEVALSCWAADFIYEAHLTISGLRVFGFCLAGFTKCDFEVNIYLDCNSQHTLLKALVILLDTNVRFATEFHGGANVKSWHNSWLFIGR